jgi:hypothetical protein
MPHPADYTLLLLLVPAALAIWLGWHLGAFCERLSTLVQIRRRVREIERDMLARGFERGPDGNWHHHPEDP